MAAVLKYSRYQRFQKAISFIMKEFPDIFVSPFITGNSLIPSRRVIDNDRFFIHIIYMKN